jgi:hypothetical protein
MEMEITFPGGARVDASFGPYVVQTDQPSAGGGEGSAPTPFAVFLASLGTRRDLRPWLPAPARPPHRRRSSDPAHTTQPGTG